MIYWITEMPSSGKIPRNFPNCRTEFAWFIASEGYVVNFFEMNRINPSKDDIAILIIPKREDLVREIFKDDTISIALKNFGKLGMMQEGPSNYWLDYPLDLQIEYYNFVVNLDFIFAHNESDKAFYQGMFGKSTFVNHSLMIEDTIKNIIAEPKEQAIIGGNFVQWYGGFQSYIVAKEFGVPIFAPSMGRMDVREKELDIYHLPYMQWNEWINELRNYRYAVHMMPTAAAGTFALNCAYLGIPCIGNENIDTQRLLFPITSFENSNVLMARTYAQKLMEKDFYNEVSDYAKSAYRDFFSEDVWKKRFNESIRNIVGEYYES